MVRERATRGSAGDCERCHDVNGFAFAGEFFAGRGGGQGWMKKIIVVGWGWVMLGVS